MKCRLQSELRKLNGRQLDMEFAFDRSSSASLSNLDLVEPNSENIVDFLNHSRLSCVIHAGVADASTTTGTCQVAQTISAGESCSASDAQCAQDYYCDNPGMHCVAGGVLNNNCSTEAPCKTQFMCSGGKCVAKLDDGKACTSAEQCTNGVCVEVINLCAAQENLSPSEPFCTEIRGTIDGG